MIIQILICKLLTNTNHSPPSPLIVAIAYICVVPVCNNKYTNVCVCGCTVCVHLHFFYFLVKLSQKTTKKAARCHKHLSEVVVTLLNIIHISICTSSTEPQYHASSHSFSFVSNSRHTRTSTYSRRGTYIRFGTHQMTISSRDQNDKFNKQHQYTVFCLLAYK